MGSVRVACALTVAALILGQQPPQRPTFRGSARFVRVDVYPTDSAGKPIEGLTAGDFELFEDGTLQTVEAFEFVRVGAEPEALRQDPNSQREGEDLAKDPRARLFAIVLDTRHVSLASGRDVRIPLTNMLDRLIGPRDLFGVITPQLPASSLVLGRRTTTLADMIDRYWYWGGDDAWKPQDDAERLFERCFGSRLTDEGELTRELVARYRERQTLEHLRDLVEKLGTIRDERKAVIVVTRGWRLFRPDHGMVNRLPSGAQQAIPAITHGGGRVQGGAALTDASDCSAEATSLLMMESERQFKELMEKAARSNVAFYPIDPRGLAPFDESIDMPVRSAVEDSARVRARVNSMKVLAENTDGLAFIMNNDLDVQFRRLTDSLSAYYLLGYYSTNTRFDGGYRRLDVKVRRPGAEVRARRGYFAPTEAEIATIAAGREAAARPPSAEEVSLVKALSRLAELSHDRELFVQTALVPGAVLVNTELGVNARTSTAWEAGGEIHVKAISPSGTVTETRKLARLQFGAAFRIPETSNGEVRVEVRARAARPGESSADRADVTVRSSESFLLGPPLSYRGSARALTPAADGRYRRTERVTIEAQVNDGATPAGARMLDRTGKPLTLPVATRERVDSAGVRWMVAEASLAPLTDGDYIIELEAMKHDQRERALFAIRVVR